MRVVANFIMRGRTQALLVVVGAMVLPLLFWLGAAGAALIALRRGWADALSVAGWALIPGVMWWYLGDPWIASVLLATLGLAAVLRQTNQWLSVMLASVLVGACFAVIAQTVLGSSINELLRGADSPLPAMLEQAFSTLESAEREQIEAMLQPIFIGVLAAFLQTVVLGSLMLARYWQAALYNPEGFGREFRAFRLPLGIMAALLAGVLFAPYLGASFAALVPICSVPLAFAGLALMHGLAKQGRVKHFWLVGVYVLLILLPQVMYPALMVLAVVDSVFDLRGRLSRSQQPTDGEG